MASDRDIDPASIFLRENYEPDAAFRIAEGAEGHEDDGVTGPMHPLAILAIGLTYTAAIGIAGGLLVALVWRAI